MNDIAIRKIEKIILEVMQGRYPGAKFDRDIRADFRAMAEAITRWEDKRGGKTVDAVDPAQSDCTTASLSHMDADRNHAS